MLSHGSSDWGCLLICFKLWTKFFVLLISHDFNNFDSTFEKKLRFSLSKIINDESITVAGLARLGGVARVAEVKFTSVLHEASHLAVTWQARLCLNDILRNGVPFSEVPKPFGRISGDIILFESPKQGRLEARNFEVILIFIPFTIYEKINFTE